MPAILRSFESDLNSAVHSNAELHARAHDILRGVKSESRTERNERQVRGRIVAAAAELFDEQGVEAAKIEASCDDADVALHPLNPSRGDTP